MENRLSTLTAQHDAMGRAASLVKWVVALACAHNHQKSEAAMIYQTRWPTSPHFDLITKSAVGAGTTTDAVWAAPLVPLAPLAAAFMDLVRPRTVLGRLVGVRKAPFNTRFIVQTSGTLATWVGEGKSTPVQALGFTANSLPVSKLGLIVPLSEELVRSFDPAALPLIERDLVNGIAQGGDVAFLDPAVAAVAGLNPASITNGTTAIVSGGSTAAMVEADLLALIAAVNGGVLVAPAFVLKSSTAIYLSRLRDVSGARTFPNMGFAGGDIFGIPALVSDSVGDRIVLIEANEVLLADGLVELDVSTQATLQMNSTPDDPSNAATVMRSLYSENLVAVKALRFVTWKRARTTSAAYISGVTF